MNWLINFYWDVRLKIEDKISDWKWNRELNKKDVSLVSDYDDNEISASWEEVEVKPKKKKAKKKSVKKAKKSV
jgi:hypothetical protein